MGLGIVEYALLDVASLVTRPNALAAMIGLAVATAILLLRLIHRG